MLLFAVNFASFVNLTISMGPRWVEAVGRFTGLGEDPKFRHQRWSIACRRQTRTGGVILAFRSYVLLTFLCTVGTFIKQLDPLSLSLSLSLQLIVDCTMMSVYKVFQFFDKFLIQIVLS